MPIKKKTKVKKIKFYKVVFKLSAKQKNLIEKCSKYEKTTSNRFIKTAIKNHVMRYADRIIDDESNLVSENQLKLFDFEEKDKQMVMFVEEEE